jgi:DNA-binding transcriptional LysR family regulator
VRKIATFSYGLYAGREYIKQAGFPASLEDLRNHKLIGLRSRYPNHGPAVWWDSHCDPAAIAIRCDRTLERLGCAEANMGITLLARVLGEEAGLVRILPNEPLPKLEIFLLAQPGALRVPAVRMVAEQLAAYARGNATAF